jgi:hypothetical protein
LHLRSKLADTAAETSPQQRPECRAVVIADLGSDRIDIQIADVYELLSAFGTQVLENGRSRTASWDRLMVACATSA